MNRVKVIAPRQLPRARGNGVVLLALLIALTLIGISLMAAVDVWSLARQRAREKELLFVGDQYRRAIQRYYFGAPPGTPRVLPAKLEELLEDDRYPTPVHHIRRLYPDPMTGGEEWGVLRISNRISGIYSKSGKEPIKQANFAPDYQQLEGRKTYRDWLFAISNTGKPTAADPSPFGTPASGVAPTSSAEGPAYRQQP